MLERKNLDVAIPALASASDTLQFEDTSSRQNKITAHLTSGRPAGYGFPALSQQCVRRCTRLQTQATRQENNAAVVAKLDRPKGLRGLSKSMCYLMQV